MTLEEQVKELQIDMLLLKKFVGTTFNSLVLPKDKPYNYNDHRRDSYTVTPETLAKVYKQSTGFAAVIGELCDNHLDKSGALLGVVRSMAMEK